MFDCNLWCRTTLNRKHYSKEQKIEEIQWHHDNAKIVCKIATSFSIDRKQVLSWAKYEESILQIKSSFKTKRYAKVTTDGEENSWRILGTT